MFRLLCILIGYAFGAIQTAYIVGRANGIDIREHGSKNAGFTNTNRVLGRKAGLIVFIVDVLKAIGSIVLARILFPEMEPALITLYAGIGAILGHAFPFYLKFKGGKGVSCAVGLILMLDWRIALACLIAGVIVLAASKFISLTSLTITLVVPIAMLILGYAWESVALAFLFCALIWILHRENIKRLIKGDENKFSFKKRR